MASPEVLAAAELIRHLYEDLGERTGGPLHAMLDDLNIDDGQVDQAISGKYDHFAYLWDGSFERHSQAGEDVSVEHRQAIETTCRQILTIFDHVPMSWRAAAIGWYEGWQTRYLTSEVCAFEPPFATPEQIADVLEEFEPKAVPEGSGCSSSVPCPPFQDVTLSVVND